MEHYVLIQWPESQQVIETAIAEGWNEECYLCMEVDSAYFVPIERIEAMKPVTRETMANALLTYQLNIVGKTKTEMIDDDKWRFNWTITKQQYKEFRGYAIPLIRKVFKCNKTKAEDNFAFFFQNFGLRIKN